MMASVDREPPLRDSSSDRHRPLGPAGMVGRKFGPYRIRGLIAEGGMGAVYEAFHEGLQRSVALKTLSPSHRSSEDVQRFVAEARIVARLTHPHLVPVLDVGEAGGVLYLAMELVRGESLHERVRVRGVLDEEEALCMIRQAALGLQHAHDAGVLHRDLKPANVLVDGDGNARLTDFGVAKVVGSNRLTATGTALGTPNYMSPEQAMGRNEELDARSDVYGLGAVLYECLTGTPPFNEATALDTMNAVVREPVRPPREHNPGISSETEQLCLRCLAKRPEHRYESAREVADEIEEILRGRARAPQDDPIAPLRRAGVYLLGVVAVASTTLAALLAVHARSGRGVATSPASRAESVVAELRAEATRALKEGEPATLRVLAHRLSWEGLAKALQRAHGDAPALASALGGPLALEERLGLLRARALAKAATGDEARLAAAVEAARLDPAGELGRRSALSVARALRRRGRASSLRLAESFLSPLVAGEGELARAARRELAACWSARGAWQAASALLAPDADGEPLAAALEALTPARRLEDFLRATTTADAQGPLLVLSSRRHASLWRVGEDGPGEGPVRRIALGTQRLTGVACGDPDGDGHTDLLLAAEEGGYAFFFFVPTSDGATPRQACPAQVGMRVASVAAGDLDGDGRTDFVALAAAGSTRSFALLGSRAGAPLYLEALADSKSEGSGAPRAALADFDGDGRDELLVGRRGPDEELVEFFALPPNAEGLIPRGRLAASSVGGLVPLRRGPGPGRALAVGSSEVALLGQVDGAPAVLARWSLNPPAVRATELVAWEQSFGGELWIGRSYRDRARGRRVLEWIRRAALSEDRQDAELRLTRPEPNGPALALSADLDGDGTDELLLGRELLGTGRRSPNGAGDLLRAGEAPPAPLERLLLAVRAHEALGHTEEAQAGRALLRALPGGERHCAHLDLAVAEDLLRDAEDLARGEPQANASKDAGDPGTAAASLRRAGLTLLEEVARRGGVPREVRARALLRAAAARGEGGDLERAVEELESALALGGLTGTERDFALRSLERWSARAHCELLELDFLRELESGRLGVMRPLRTAREAGGVRLRCAASATNALLCFYTGGGLPLELEGELTLDGGAWLAALRLGLFERGGSGSLGSFTGVEVALSSQEAGRLTGTAFVRGRALAPTVSLPDRGDLVLRLLLETAPGGGVEGLLQARSGDGKLLASARVAEPTASFGRLTSAYLGAHAPESSDPNSASVEPRNWPMGTWVVLRSLRLRARRQRIAGVRGIWHGHAALLLGRTDEALNDYEAALRSPSYRADALWSRGIARGRKGDPRAHEDLLQLARENPYVFLLRCEDLGDGFAGSPRDLETVGSALEALAGADALAGAIVRSLRGEWSAPTGLDPTRLGGPQAAAACYLLMRNVDDPRGRWSWQAAYRRSVGGLRRLPRTRFPPVLDLRGSPLDDAAFASLLDPAGDLPQRVACLRRAVLERPSASLPRLRLAASYVEAGLYGEAESELRRAARLATTDAERGVALLELARAQLALARTDDALRSLGRAQALGVDRDRLGAFASDLGHDPRFRALLAR
ncbi:MAG: hypothetical protein D6731_25575 [Planctomycetota bacterium]|nr:MAG: hypothetical protein D6731_25575 [Planctomycetota bacterium]